MDKHTQVLPTPVEAFIGLEEATEILKLRKSSIYALTSKRSIPHYKRGGKLYFLRSELNTWLAQGKREVIDSYSAANHLQTLRGGK